MEEFEISIQPTTIVRTVETDVLTLQRMVRENWQMYSRAVERLRKARRQRDEARTEVMRLTGELELWKKVREVK